MKTSPGVDAEAEPVEFVTVTWTSPSSVVDGEVTVIVVGESTVTLAADTVREPNFTTEPTVNRSPVIMTVVPPVVGPLVAESDCTSAGRASKVKVEPGVSGEVPAPLVTVTPAGPVDWAESSPPAAVGGVTAMMVVGDTMSTDAAGTPSNATDDVEVKPVPVIVTWVPPPNEPALGEIESTAGMTSV